MNMEELRVEQEVELETLMRESHDHCNSCVKHNCLQTEDACELVYCSRDCGARYHQCKEEDHADLCPCQQVPCINAASGCPLTMRRDRRAAHLSRCPASVVLCTMEWNRWPVYRCAAHAQHSVTVPFLSDAHAQPADQPLDMALALRDQRALATALKAPISTQRALRNKLTQRHPAVPLSLNPVPDVTQDDVTPSCDNQHVRNNCAYARGVNSALMDDNLKQATTALTDNLTSAICSDDSLEGASVFQKHPEGDLLLVQGRLVRVNLDEKMQPYKDLTKLQRTLIRDHIYQSVRRSYYTEHAQDATEPEVDRNDVIGVDLTTEYITRYQTKPRAMYTFLCAQSYRRDEYQWHHKTVHDVIHGGLDGWLEQRCPLAHLGCGYTQRRLSPGHCDVMVYSELLERFGLQRRRVCDAAQDCDVSSDVSLDSLPNEVVLLIMRHCDSFSLASLALVNSRMRELACSMLDMRGIVQFVWRPRGQGHWEVDYKKWTFSGAMDPVPRWRFEEMTHLSSHLQTCPYNVRAPPPAQTMVQTALRVLKVDVTAMPQLKPVTSAAPPFYR